MTEGNGDTLSASKANKTVSQEENDLAARNPMLYDPLQEGQSHNSKIRQYLAALIVCLGAVAAGTALAWTSPVLPQISIHEPTKPANNTLENITFSNINDTLNHIPNININSTILNITDAANSSSVPTSHLQLTADQQTWVSSLVAIGAFFGALPAGYIADIIGRRYTAMAMCVPFVVAWLSIIFAQSAAYLYFGRFIIGIATGSFCVVAPMYISEIAEVSIRGSLGTLFQLLLTVGILLVYVIGSVVDWITLSWLCLFVPVALFFGMILLPETPTYLLKKGRRGDAALALKWLWGRYCDSRSAIQDIQSELDSAGGKASFSDLFTNRANFNGLVIAMLLMFFQQFSGINAVIFYTQPIFASSGSTLNPSLCSIIVGLVQVVMTFTSSLVIERAGRKVLLLFGSVSMTICLAILGAYFNMKDSGKDVTSIGWLPLLCVVLFMVTFSVGYGPVPWLMMGELFTSDVKATAAALTVMANWFSVFVVTKSFGAMVEAWGSAWTFWFFGFCMAVATFYVLFRVLETKGKSSSEIQMWLSRGK